MKRTSIEWTDFSANPVKYRNRNPYLDEAELKAMLSVKRLPAGSKVFVGDMTDVFGPWVPDEMLDRMFAVFALRPDVVFQLLTKRPERMRAYLNGTQIPCPDDEPFEGRRDAISYAAEAYADGPVGEAREAALHWPVWPLPNVWLGTSVEDQARADERIPELLATPAAVRFLSVEPMLGPVDLKAPQEEWGTPDGSIEDFRRHLWSCDRCGGTRYYDSRIGMLCGTCKGRGSLIDWVIVGGESGPGARPCDLAWIRSIVAQCQAAAVPVFVKQLGSKPYRDPEPTGNFRDGPDYPGQRQFEVKATALKLTDRKGGDPEEWPEDLRVREFPL